MSPLWVKLSRPRRWRQLHRGQKLEGVDATGLEHVQQAVKEGQGVLITPNHSAHYDSAALYAAADKISQPLYFLTAWQVFAMSSRFECWAMQRLGCFSIDRESTDRQAFKQAVKVLQEEPHPLVIFPEGDIYHVSDRVTPFREGAAAIALSASKRSERPIVAIPCGIKFRYVEDPTQNLLELMGRLEDRLLLRPGRDAKLPDRIYRLAEAVLSLKELDYLGASRTGTVKERAASLGNAILSQLEERHKLPGKGGTTPERVKNLRQCIIRKLEGGVEHGEKAEQSEKPEDSQPSVQLTEADQRAMQQEMDDLFFVMQLYSYPGDYLHGEPTIERLAETLDKFEEDILGVPLPSVRGRRRVEVHFGEPIAVGGGEERRGGTGQLTALLQDRVQAILNRLNASSNGAPSARIHGSSN
jgi:hypothetical protein